MTDAAPPNGPATERLPRLYTAPRTALAVGLLGIALYPLALVGAVLGLRAFLALSKDERLPGRRLALVAMLMPGLLLPVVTVEAVVATMALKRVALHEHQVECKANLKALWAAEERFRQENQHWAGSFAELGFQVPKRNRYTYFLSPVEAWPADPKLYPHAAREDRAMALARLGLQLGVRGQCPDCSLVMACAGNDDKDATLDVWSVASFDREGKHGGTVPAGVPYNDVSDAN